MIPYAELLTEAANPTEKHSHLPAEAPSAPVNNTAFLAFFAF